MLDLLIACLLCAAVAWLVSFAFGLERGPAPWWLVPLVLLLVAIVLVALAGVVLPLPFGGVAAQLATVLVLAFGGAILRKLA